MTEEGSSFIGRLPVHRFGSAGPIAVVAHGITANGLSIGRLGAAVADAGQVWAPDLRGRAEARDLPGPWGLSGHADDLISVLEVAAAESGGPVALAGHSMGAFVAGLAAARRPDLVSRLVLIDGGLAIPLPSGTSADAVDEMIQAVIGPAMARLSMTFADPQAYLDFWADHPAIGAFSTAPGLIGDAVRGYLLHDLVATAQGWRSSCVLDAVRADGADVFTDVDAHAAPMAALAAGVPVRLLWAPRGLLDQPQGLYDADRLAALQLPAELRVDQIADVNHYTVLFADHAVQALADALLD